MARADPCRAPALADPEPESVAGEFSAVFRAHADFVWRTLRALGVAPEALDDALQDVFLVVHRRLSEFEGRSSLSTWLYAITYRTALRHRRRRARQPLEEISPELPSPDPDPQQRASRAQAGEFVMAFLDRLSDAKRDAFVLCALERMTAREAAELLGVSPNTVSSRLRLARADFHRALEGFRLEGGDGDD